MLRSLLALYKTSSLAKLTLVVMLKLLMHALHPFLLLRDWTIASPGAKTWLLLSNSWLSHSPVTADNKPFFCLVCSNQFFIYFLRIWVKTRRYFNDHIWFSYNSSWSSSCVCLLLLPCVSCLPPPVLFLLHLLFLNSSPSFQTLLLSHVGPRVPTTL